MGTPGPTARVPTPTEPARPPARPARRKFNNQPVEVGGLKFDSKKEARRWHRLVADQRAGLIRQLRRQVKFVIRVNGAAVCRYVADFTYLDRAGRYVVEDVKSKITRAHPVYRLKRKLMRAALGIEIKET